MSQTSCSQLSIKVSRQLMRVLVSLWEAQSMGSDCSELYLASQSSHLGTETWSAYVCKAMNFLSRKSFIDHKQTYIVDVHIGRCACTDDIWPCKADFESTCRTRMDMRHSLYCDYVSCQPVNVMLGNAHDHQITKLDNIFTPWCHEYIRAKLYITVE